MNTTAATARSKSARPDDARRFGLQSIRTKSTGDPSKTRASSICVRTHYTCCQRCGRRLKALSGDGLILPSTTIQRRMDLTTMTLRLQTPRTGDGHSVGTQFARARIAGDTTRIEHCLRGLVVILDRSHTGHAKALRLGIVRKTHSGGGEKEHTASSRTLAVHTSTLVADLSIYVHLSTAARLLFDLLISHRQLMFDIRPRCLLGSQRVPHTLPFEQVDGPRLNEKDS